MGLPRLRIWTEEGGGLGTITKGLYHVQQSEEEERGKRKPREGAAPQVENFQEGKNNGLVLILLRSLIK